MKDYRKGISAYQKESSGFMKTGETPSAAGVPAETEKVREEKRKPAVPPGSIKSGVDRASKFLMLLEKDDAARVMRHLSPEELEAVSKKIAETGRIDAEEANSILREFGLIREKGETYFGGPAVAKNMLVNAFGEEKGEKFFKKAVPYGGSKPFAFLNDYEFQQIIMILKKEPPGVLGIVLQYLEPRRASKILESLTPDVQRAVVKHIAGMEKIDSEVLLRMEEVIKQKILKQGKVITEEIDGKSVLADILKHVNAAAEEEILQSLETSDPGLTEEIREKLFGIETIASLHDKDLQEVLRDYDDAELAFLLKGKPEQFSGKILSNVSERRRELIENEISFLGGVKRSEVEKATKDFLRYLQTQVEEGRLRLFREGDGETYV
jgi:flagellar motor switch protein FliG